MDQPSELEFSYLLFGGLTFILILTLAIVLFISLYQKKLYNQQKDLQILEISYQKELTSLIIKSQEGERARISNDLHDEIGVSLSAAKLYINQIRFENQPDEMIHLAKDANDILSQIVKDIRLISQNLSPLPLENFGLEQAVRMLLKNLEKGGLKTVFKIEGYDSRLTPETELGIYRIIQEAIGNTLKHAQATHILVDISIDNQHIKLNIKDNGIGFDTDKIASDPTSSIGLSGIKARTGLLNGKLVFNSTPGEGTNIILTIPKTA